MSGVYSIQILNKYYIGSSKNIAKRINQHIGALRYGNHYNYRLQNLYNKYGLDYFLWSVLEYCSDYKEREQVYLDIFISDQYCINSSRVVGVANASPLTAIRRRETMRARRLQGKYKYLRTPWKAVAARIGSKHTQEVKEAHSKLMKTKFADPAYRAKALERHKNRIFTNDKKTPFSITDGINIYGPFKIQKDAYGKVPIGVTSLNRLFKGHRTEINGYYIVKHK